MRYKKVRKIFLFPDINESNDLIWTPPNKTGVLSLLCKEHHLNKERVEKNLKKFDKSYHECREYFEFTKNRIRIKQATLENML